MAIEFQCPNPDCGKMLKVPESHAGKPARCPACNKLIRVTRPRASRKKLQPHWSALEDTVGAWIVADTAAQGEQVRELEQAPVVEPPPGEEADAALEAAGGVGLPPGAQVSKALRCPACHHPVGRGLRICPYCGRYVRVEEEDRRKAARKLARRARRAKQLRREVDTLRRSGYAALTRGPAARAMLAAVVVLGGGIGAVPFFVSPTQLHGEWLSTIALVAILLAGIGVATRVSVLGRPRSMTPFVLLVAAGWAYQIVVTIEMLVHWGVHAHGQGHIGWGYCHLGAVVGVGVASAMILRMKRFGLAILAIFVIVGILVGFLMRGYTGAPGYLPTLSYVDMGRVLIAMVGLLVFNEHMD
jgi:hypothetical protein